MDQSVYEITKSQVLKADLLASGIADLNEHVKAIKLEELYDELKQMIKERDELRKDLQAEAESKATMKGDVETHKLNERNILEKLEEVSGQLQNAAVENQEASKKLKSEQEIREKQTKKLKKLVDTLEFNTSKGYANAKLILNIYKEDPTLVGIVSGQIIARIEKLNEEPDEVKREAEKTALLLEEFAKIIIYVRNAIDEKTEIAKDLSKTLKASLIANQELRQSGVREHQSLDNSFNNNEAKSMNRSIQHADQNLLQSARGGILMNEQGLQMSFLNSPRNQIPVNFQEMGLQTSMLNSPRNQLNVNFQEMGFQTSTVLNQGTSRVPVNLVDQGLQSSNIVEQRNNRSALIGQDFSAQTSTMPIQLRTSVYERGIDALRLSKLFEQELDKERQRENQRIAVLEREKRQLEELEKCRELQRQEEREKERKLYQGREKTLRDEIRLSNEGFRMLEDQFMRLQERLTSVKKDETSEKIEYLKKKVEAFKDENVVLSDKIVILSAANEQFTKDSEEKTLLLLRNIRDLKKINKTLGEDETDFHKVSDFARYNFEEKFKAEADNINKTVDDLRFKLERLSRSKGKTRKEGMDIGKMQDDLMISEKTNVALQQALQETYIKIKELRKQNKELFEKQQIRILQEPPKMLEQYTTKRQADHVAELSTKDRVITSLIKINNELTNKLKNFQAEKLRVLKDRKNCEELYAYFDLKATAIFLQSEKVAAVVGENKRLRRLAEEIFYMTSKENVEHSKALDDSTRCYQAVLDELGQLILVAATDEDFDPTEFRKALYGHELSHDIKDRVVFEKKNKVKKQEIEVKSEVKEQARPSVKVREEVRLSDIETLTRLNHVLIENQELRAKLEVQTNHITQTNKDIYIYKKKVKNIVLMEPKIERVIVQNLKLKAALLETQETAMHRMIEEESKVLDLHNQTNMAHELAETTEDVVKKLTIQKKALEKKIAIIMNQKNLLSKDLEINTEHEKRVVGELNNEIHLNENRIADLEILAAQLVEAKKEISRQELEIERLRIDGESFKGTIALLEKNLTAVTTNNVTDKDQLRDDITKERKRLETQIDEHKALMTNKFALEGEVQKLRDKIGSVNTELKAKEDELRDLKIKVDKKEADIAAFTDANREITRRLEKAELELSLTAAERSTLAEDNASMKQKLESFLDKNVSMLSEERAKINDELSRQYAGKITSLEEQLYNQHKEIGDSVYTVERKEREVADLKNKLQMKNKQLIQFNSYFASMGSSKNSKEVEVSRILLQNRSLLRELEILRSQKAHLKELYDRLVKNIESKQASPPSHFEASQVNDMKLGNLKNTMDQLYIDNYNLKSQLEVLMACYEEKLSFKDHDIELLKNKVIKFENDALYFEKELRTLKVDYDDLADEVGLLREKNAALSTEHAADKETINEIRNRNRLLTEQLQSIKERLNITESNSAFNGSLVDENTKLRDKILQFNGLLDILRTESQIKIEELEKGLNELKIRLREAEEITTTREVSEKLETLKGFVTKLQEIKEERPHMDLQPSNPAASIYTILKILDEKNGELAAIKDTLEHIVEVNDELENLVASLQDQLLALNTQFTKVNLEKDEKIRMQAQKIGESENKTKVSQGRLEQRVKELEAQRAQTEAKLKEVTQRSSEDIKGLEKKLANERQEFEQYRQSKQQEISKLKQDWKDLKDAVDKQFGEIQHKNHDISELKAKLESTHKEKMQLAEHIKNRTEELKELEEENDELADKIEELTRLLSKDKTAAMQQLYEAAKSENDVLRDSLYNLQREKARQEAEFKSEIDRLREEITIKSNTVEKLVAKIEKKASKLKETNTRLISGQREMEELTRRQTQSLRAESSLAEVKEALKAQTDNYRALDQAYTDLKELFKVKEDQLKNLIMKLRDTSADLKTATDSVSQLEGYLVDYKKTQQELQFLNIQYKNMERGNKNMQSKIERLTAELAEENKRNERLKKNNSFLEDELRSPTKQKD